MPFPEHIAAVLDEYGITPATKAALYDLYISLGNPVLEVFADLAANSGFADATSAEDIARLRRETVERFVRRSHPLWLEGRPTPSLWHPRELEGRAAGLASPLGMAGEEESTDFAVRLMSSAMRVLEPGQSPPKGLLMLGRNAHFGGRQETISFDVVAMDVEDAVALALAEGQQHTLPGSVGETSGTIDVERSIALIWEIQPNVYKPAGDRNRVINQLYRRHRNWHVVTLLAAFQWLEERGFSVYIVRGAALAAAHEVNAAKPVVQEIADLHDRTVRAVASALGLELAEASDEEEFLLLESSVMNTGLRRHVLEHGAAGAIWSVRDRRTN